MKGGVNYESDIFSALVMVNGHASLASGEKAARVRYRQFI
jgi:hypothetical protein